MDPDRVTRAAVALENGATVTPSEDGRFVVESFTGDRTYSVDLERRTCSCPDAMYRGAMCKHLALTALVRGLGGET